jgi:CheY-like chemotaxis protein
MDKRHSSFAGMPPAQPPADSPSNHAMRFLIADDEAINRIVLGERLSQLGHVYIAVNNGSDALAALDDSAWDALLLDCHMPVMDGFETVAAIRRNESGGAPRTWVIAVTASAIDGEREACLSAGMDDFLLKPIHAPQLVEVIARIPARDKTSGPPVNQSRLDGLAGSKSKSGENLLVRMVKLFTESGPELIDEMERALREDDFTAAIGAVHKLAGGCSYFGAEVLYSHCMDFERLGRAGDHAGLRNLAPIVRQEYARVEEALRAER